MRIGKVLGTVTLSQQQASFAGGRWLIVRPLNSGDLVAEDHHGASGAEPTLVVYDCLGAGEGDLIGFVEGGEATAPFTEPTPVDAYNAAILDRISYQPPQSGATGGNS